MVSRGYPDFFRSLHDFNKLGTIPSQPGSGHCKGLFRVHRPLNMEEPWEFLTVPAEIQSSCFGKETSSDCPEPEKLSEKTEGNNKSKVYLPFTATGVITNLWANVQFAMQRMTTWEKDVIDFSLSSIKLCLWNRLSHKYVWITWLKGWY